MGSRSMPHGFAYCKSSRERRVGSPAGQYLGCVCVLSLVFILVSRLLGLRVSSRTGSSQQSPTLWLRLAPSASPWCFAISDARRVYLVDSFIACDRQPNAHTKSLVLHLVWSHLQWLANCSYSNGGRPSPSLHLWLFVHEFNWLTSCCHGASPSLSKGSLSLEPGVSSIDSL